MHIFHEAGKVARCEASDITRFHSHASHIISYHQLSCTSYYELSPTLMHLISRAFTNSHAPHITSLSPTLMHLTSHRFHQLSCTSHHIAFTNSHHENPRARGAVSFLTRFPHQKDPPEKSFWSCSAGEILLLRLLGLETTQQGNPTPPGGGFLRST